MADQIVHRTVRLRTSPTRTIRLQSGVPSIYMVSSTINQTTGELIITLNNGATLNMGTVTNKMYKFVVTASAVAGATVLTNASLSPYNYFLEVDGHSLVPDPSNEDGYDWTTLGTATLTTALKGGEQVIATAIQTNLYQTPVNVVSSTITAENVIAFGMSDSSVITAGTLSDNDEAAVWGNITGTLADQTDLVTTLSNYYTKTDADATFATVGQLDSKLDHTGGTISNYTEDYESSVTISGTYEINVETCKNILNFTMTGSGTLTTTGSATPFKPIVVYVSHSSGPWTLGLEDTDIGLEGDADTTEAFTMFSDGTFWRLWRSGVVDVTVTVA